MHTVRQDSRKQLACLTPPRSKYHCIRAGRESKVLWLVAEAGRHICSTADFSTRTNRGHPRSSRRLRRTKRCIEGGARFTSAGPCDYCGGSSRTRNSRRACRVGAQGRSHGYATATPACIIEDSGRLTQASPSFCLWAAHFARWFALAYPEAVTAEGQLRVDRSLWRFERFRSGPVIDPPMISYDEAAVRSLR